MMHQKLPDEFLKLLAGVTGKRSRVVVEHILAHGFITTEDLEVTYGYKHPPRAIRDVREQGIPLETFQTRNAQGRIIAAYRFPESLESEPQKIGGRRSLSRSLKKQLIDRNGAICQICFGQFNERFLQVDHQIPYEVIGDHLEMREAENHMLLCRSCNRAKSWSCEHCANWQKEKQPATCLTCYWANPSAYEHIALSRIRRLDLTWMGEDVAVYDEIARQALIAQQNLTEYVKQILKQHLSKPGKSV